MSRTRKNHLEFANFICKFGKKNLLDFGDLVVAALLSRGERRFGKSRYLILNAKVVDLREGYVGVAFDFVKDTSLERSQVLVEHPAETKANGEAGPPHPTKPFLVAELVDAHLRMQSSPSAICLLVLNSHRLVYLPKTPYAPTMAELEATCARMIERQRGVLIAAELKSVSRSDRVAARKKLEAKYPRANLKIVPLAGSQEIQDALSQFKVIKNLTITLLETNNELDFDGFFRKMRSQGSDLGATSTKLEHANAKGLDHEAAVKEITAAAAQGNTRLKVKGTDVHDNPLTQVNQDVRVQRAATFEPSTPSENAADMFASLLDVAGDGMVLVEPQASIGGVAAAVKELYEKWNSHD